MLMCYPTDFYAFFVLTFSFLFPFFQVKILVLFLDIVIHENLIYNHEDLCIQCLSLIEAYLPQRDPFFGK